MQFKLIFACMLAMLSAAASAATAPRVYRNIYTDNNAIAVEMPDAVSDTGRTYIGARLNYSLIGFDNEYSLASDPSYSETDAFSMKPQLGFDVAFGYNFSERLRAEFDYAYMGQYQDKDAGMAFDVMEHHFTINGIYTFAKWTTTSMYAGAGIGAGFLTTKWIGTGYFDATATTDKSSVGFAGNAQIGIEEMLTPELRLGAYYKLSYLTGHKQEIKMSEQNDFDTFIVDNTGIMGHTFGVGLRFVF